MSEWKQYTDDSGQRRRVQHSGLGTDSENTVAEREIRCARCGARKWVNINSYRGGATFDPHGCSSESCQQWSREQTDLLLKQKDAERWFKVILPYRLHCIAVALVGPMLVVLALWLGHQESEWAQLFAPAGLLWTIAWWNNRFKVGVRIVFLRNPLWVDVDSKGLASEARVWFEGNEARLVEIEDWSLRGLNTTGW